MEKEKKDKKDKKLPDEDLDKVVAGFGENDRYSCSKVADNATFNQNFNANPTPCLDFQQKFGTDHTCYCCTNCIPKGTG